MTDRFDADEPRLGEFPFRLTSGPAEPRYLRWIRNHSNYMAERGFRDYLRIVAVLVRGILINFLTLLPYLLVIGLVLALLHETMVLHRFYLTGSILALALVWVFFFPIVTRLSDIRRYKKSRETGSGSSVESRDLAERRLGGILLALLGAFLAESLQWALFRYHAEITVENSLVALAIACAAVVIGSQLLPGLAGTGKTLAVLLVGGLGLLVPLLVVLYVMKYATDYPAEGQKLELMMELPRIEELAAEQRTLAELVKDNSFLGSEYWLELESERIAELWADTEGLAEKIADLPSEPGREEQPDPRGEKDEPSRTIEEWELRGHLWQTIEKLWKQDERTEQSEIGAKELRIQLRNAWDQMAKALAQQVELLETEHAELAREIDALKEGREERIGSLREPKDLFKQHLALIVLPVVGAGCLVLAVGTGLITGTLKLAAVARILGWLILLLLLSLLLLEAFSRLGTPGIWALYLVGAPEAVEKVVGWVGDQVVMEKSFVLLGWAIELWLFCWLAVDVNRTSVHGLYRDRLASAYLIGVNKDEEVDIEEDVDLRDICHYEARSVAPYHLVNVALNLQGSKDEALRDRNCDFFVFSKRFIGGGRTGYCRSETMEMVHPSLSLGVAMAISAAAASPNMGRGTNPLAVAFMTLLNVRLGYWLPHPGLLHDKLSWKAKPRKDRKGRKPPWKRKDHRPGIDFKKVFAEEWGDIQARREQTYGPVQVPDMPTKIRRQVQSFGSQPRSTDGSSVGKKPERAGESDQAVRPTTALGLIGLGFSGGGIRSATVNLGIAQALHRRGVFEHVDYLSTVSGGGYLGSSLSTLMRYRTPPVSEIAGEVQLSEDPRRGEKTVKVTPEGGEPREYRYSRRAVTVEKGVRVDAGSRLIARPGADGDGRNSSPQATFLQQFHWRVRPSALGREMRMKLDETHKWVNLSDGGHIENLGCVELLRRRCRFIVLGDAESDPHVHFNGLATLIRMARIDLGTEIDISVRDLRLDGNGRSRSHWSVGKIKYAKRDGEAEREHGWLLYLKSSFTGDEDEVIQEYRNNHPLFPQESTADQFFDEGQFEAYRSLGQHIGEGALDALAQMLEDPPDKFSRAEFERSLEGHS